MKDPEHLTDQQRKFIELHASGMDKVSAALKAGYSNSGAKKASSRLMKNHTILAAIAKIRAEGMKMAAYGLAEAMAEAAAVCAFAIEHKSPMAYCKGTELRARLAGLLVEELHLKVEAIDLRGAIQKAQERIVMINASPTNQHVELSQTPDQPVLGGARWETRIPGNPHGA